MKKKLTYNEIENFFNHHKDWVNDIVEASQLNSADKNRSIDLIINKLDSNDSSIRYIASHLILTFKIEKAKHKLIERILAKQTFNNNGTMTYALYHLNCKSNLVDVFRIPATQSYESKMHAYAILSEQEFEFSNDDLSEIKSIWNNTKSQELEKETLEMIEDAYNGFMAYKND